MVYDLPVEEEKVKSHQVTALHLISAFAFVGCGAIIAVYNYTIPMWGGALLVFGLLLLTLTMFKNKWLTSKKTNSLFRVAELVVAISVAVYSATQRYRFPEGIFAALALAVTFAIYWERTAGDALFVHIDDEGVKLPLMGRRRFIPWVEVEQVTLRFGALSIDCADNHLFQWNVNLPDFDADIFEAFCNTKVEENRSKRRKDDW